MAQRRCDKCSQERDLSGGKVCDRSHFFCRHCFNNSAGLLFGPWERCPYDQTKLR